MGVILPMLPKNGGWGTVMLRPGGLTTLPWSHHQGAAVAHPPCPVPLSATAVLDTLAIDLYLSRRHALAHTPGRITAALRRLLFDGLRGRPANAAP